MRRLIVMGLPNGRWRTLGLLALLFAMPFVAAGSLYLSGWRPAASAAHGALVEPPLSLARVVLGEEAGKPVRLASLGARWTLLYAGPADCPEACLRSLYAMRQVHVAQGREQPRVQRIFVAAGAVLSQRQAELLHRFPGMHVVAGQAANPAGDAWPGKILLLDPQGNLVMTYAGDADPAGMRKDLARLLAYSWVG